MEKQNQRKSRAVLFWFGTLLTCIAGGFFAWYQMKLSVEQIAKAYIVAFFMISLLEVMSGMYKQINFSDSKTRRYFFIGFLVSVSFICLDFYIPIAAGWMLGSAYIAKKTHAGIGIFYQLLLTILYSSIYKLKAEYIIAYFLIGTAICVLISLAENFKSLIYICIILTSIEVCIHLLLNNFRFEAEVFKDMIPMLCSSLIVLILCFLVRKNKAVDGAESEALEELNKKTETDNHIATSAKEDLDAGKISVKEFDNTNENKSVVSTLVEEANTPLNHEVEGNAPLNLEEEVIKDITEEELAPFITGDSPLMSRLSKEKPLIYRHSLLVGILSEKAARKLGVNKALAKAGGLYHEVGRLTIGDYVTAGEALARSQNVPEPVIDIIRQHTGKVEIPKSKEAAIVLLTDSIIATIKYYEKQPAEKKRTNEKVIDDIFRIRLEQGTLDESGLSIEEFQVLKTFYRQSLPKGGNG